MSINLLADDNIFVIVTALCKTHNNGVLKKLAYHQYYSTVLKLNQDSYSEDAVIEAYKNKILKKHKDAEFERLEVFTFDESREANSFVRRPKFKQRRKDVILKPERLTLLPSQIEKVKTQELTTEKDREAFKPVIKKEMPKKRAYHDIYE